jgi:hypothetical protein
MEKAPAEAGASLGEDPRWLKKGATSATSSSKLGFATKLRESDAKNLKSLQYGD